MAPARKQSQFPVTRWTVVIHVCQGDDEKARSEALAGICRDYWYPLYAFTRRMGYRQQDAEDLTQGFFCHLLERDVLAAANRESGRLRSFLLAVLQRYIRDTEDRQNALKRGGGREIVSFDFINAEERYRHEPADSVTPETLFERAWALHVLRAALASLRQSESAAGREAVFDVLAPFLDPESTAGASPEAIAAGLGISADGVRQSVSRLRRRFRETLRRHVSATLHEAGEAQINEELTALQSALRGT